MKVFRADEEEPMCGRCDHVDDPITFCERKCGHKHKWNGYSRTERKGGITWTTVMTTGLG